MWKQELTIGRVINPHCFTHMLNKIIILIALLAILLMMAMVIGEMVTESQLKKDVKTLFSLSQNISNKTYSSEQLEQLPEPLGDISDIPCRKISHILLCEIDA